MNNEQKILGSVPKKKGKRYIVIILVLIMLGLASYIVYDKVIKKNIVEENKDKEENNTTEIQNNESEEEKEYTNLNPELKNVLTFNLSEVIENRDKLVAVTKDGKEILLADLSEYNGEVRYDFYNGKIYLYMQKYTAGKQENGIVTVQPVHNTYLAYIDLNQGDGNYKVNIITEISSNNSPESIAATSNAIYIVSSADMAVKKYSLTDNKFEDTNIIGKDMILELFSTKDGSDYLVYNIGWDLYLLDTSTNESKIIENKSQLAFIYNGKILYHKSGTAGSGKLIYCEYDIKTGEKKILSPEVGYGSASSDTENIIPYKDGYIYFTESKVMSYNEGNYKELFDYSDIGFIYGASRRGRVCEDVIYLGFAGYLTIQNPVKDALGTKTIGLEDKKVEETSLYYDYRYTKYYEQK